MELEIGAAYRTAGSGEAWIAGKVNINNAWVWSTQGNWYEQSTGKLVRYGVAWDEERKEHVGRYYVNDFSCSFDIAEKVSESWQQD